MLCSRCFPFLCELPCQLAKYTTWKDLSFSSHLDSPNFSKRASHWICFSFNHRISQVSRRTNNNMVYQWHVEPVPPARLAWCCWQLGSSSLQAFWLEGKPAAVKVAVKTYIYCVKAFNMYCLNGIGRKSIESVGLSHISLSGILVQLTTLERNIERNSAGNGGSPVPSVPASAKAAVPASPSKQSEPEKPKLGLYFMVHWRGKTWWFWDTQELL